MKNLVGRKVKGFKFEHDQIGHISMMNDYIGQVGEIASVGEYSFHVDFGDGWFFSYPLDQIKEHLGPEWEIGEEYEFSDDGEVWDEPQELQGIIEHEFKYIVEKGGGYFNGYRHIREIKPKVKETKITFLDNQGKKVTLTIQGEVFKIEEIKIKK